MSNFDKQLEPESFPHKTDGGKIKATIANLKHLFDSYGIACEYDEILKKQSIRINSNDDNDLSETSSYAQIKSLLALNNAPQSCIDLIPALMEQSRINPILDFITAKKWDKNDRIGDLLKSITLDARSEDDVRYKNKAVVTWLVQCVAAADGGRHSPIKGALPKYELVLVLQGGQGALKTSWLRSLLPEEFGHYIIRGAHLDPADRDSVKNCISGWICELGELDATFRKADIARLKAFLSNETDAIRLPYDRVTSNFRRRTSFCASVNPREFLTDSTGARRFLPLAVTGCNANHGIDVQMMWSQVWQLYIGGHQWWCDKELETMLEVRHDEHSETNAIADIIASKVDLTNNQRLPTSIHMSISRLLSHCMTGLPNNMQIKQAKDCLEKHGFNAVQSNGIKGYWINNLVDRAEYQNTLEVK